MNFLIAYHRLTGRMFLTQFGSAGSAMQGRFMLERVRGNTDWEIVVLHAKDLATIQQTHSRYFMREWSFVGEVEA